MRDPNKDDNEKLGRILKYVSSMMELMLNLEYDGNGMVKWWVDAGFELHHNMKSHTGGMMSMGRGDMYSV